MGYKKEKEEGPDYATMSPQEKIDHRHKVWAEFSPMEQAAKRRWSASTCCRQASSSRFVGRQGEERVECSGCGKYIKTIPGDPVEASPLGANSPDQDAWGRLKKEIQTKPVEDVPF